MHDGAFFESKGIPSVALVSDAFKPQAQYQAKALGLEDAPRVFVQHPISDQTPAQLHAKADAVFEKVAEALTSNDLQTPEINYDAATEKLLKQEEHCSS